MHFIRMMAVCATVPFHHQIEFIKKFDCNSLDNNKRIKSFHGNVYERVDFESPLELFLSNTLCDQETSSRIYQQYKEIILPALHTDSDALEIINSWIIEIKEDCYDNIVPLILEQFKKAKIKTYPLNWESQIEQLLS